MEQSVTRMAAVHICAALLSMPAYAGNSEALPQEDGDCGNCACGPRIEQMQAFYAWKAALQGNMIYGSIAFNRESADGSTDSGLLEQLAFQFRQKSDVTRNMTGPEGFQVTANEMRDTVRQFRAFVHQIKITQSSMGVCRAEQANYGRNRGRSMVQLTCNGP